MKRRAGLYLTGALAAILVAAAVSFAAVPQTISYQGYLADSSGSPVNGTVQMLFALYSSQSTTAVPLWSETHQNVQVSQGRYSVVLGNGSPTPVPINLPFDVPYYLGVKVGSDTEMTPRLPLTSMGYAYRAAQAEGLISTATVTTTNTIVSSVPTGVAPLTVTSTTMVPNLNVEMVGGKHSTDFVAKIGDTMTGSLSFSSGNIILPTTTANSGIIMQGGNRLIHSYGYGSFFAGTNAGNLTNTGSYNTAIGLETLYSPTNGQSNTAIGAFALHSNTSSYNTAIGTDALYSNTTGMQNTAIGMYALYSNTTAQYMTAVGAFALNLNTTGADNTAIGAYALSSNTTGFRNTASGRAALYSNTTGANNTAIGNSALNSNTTGNENTASGVGALYSNTTGANNTAIGISALSSNTTGFRNTASGASALSSNTTGTYNTASGFEALTSNTTGFRNTASGTYALHSNTTGADNTATGMYAVYSNTTGANNTAIGFSALTSNTTGTNNTAIGFSAGQYQTTGNNNIYIGANVYGVSGESDVIRLGNTQKQAYISGTINIAGLVSAGTVSASTFRGDGSGLTGITASQLGAVNKAGDTMTGNLTVPSVTLPTTTANAGIIMQGGKRLIHSYGGLNFFAGLDAGNLNTTGNYNTASGNYSLYSNTTGDGNTANGFLALYYNTTGESNTASGDGALFSNTTGAQNTANGMNALGANNDGTGNTASGMDALYQNRSGSYNTASGAGALYNNTDGYSNNASGWGALFDNTTGWGNTAIGNNAGLLQKTGSLNTVVGFNAAAYGNGAELYNATAIGAFARVYMGNAVRIGDSRVELIYGAVNFTSESDIRVKKDIQDIGYGLGFIKQLRPVQFRRKNGNDRIDFGFIAQDIETLLGTGYNVLGIDGDTDRMLSLRYTDFIAPMVKAMQEQQAQIDEQKAMIEELKAEIAALRQRLP
jgi:hypothetical protein